MGKFCIDMSEDFLRTDDFDLAKKKSLFEIKTTLNAHGLSNSSFNLPDPGEIIIAEPDIDHESAQRDSEIRIKSLNQNQFAAFNKIMKAVNDSSHEPRCFYLDGPGGSGKTYLYSTVISALQARGEKVHAFATTGIAATLLKEGRTVHSGFKLPVPLLDTSTSQMKTSFADADLLRMSDLIIIDEATMLPKDGLRCIDLLLREIMRIEKPFGAKVMILGGDFRQTLPVVPRGNRIHIIEACIKSSHLWSVFYQLKLTENMRSEGKTAFNSWVLKIGDGTINAKDVHYRNDLLEIPNEMLVNDSIVDAIYGVDVNLLTAHQFAERIILAAKNKDALSVNNEIIGRLNGCLRIYKSADSLISDNPQDILNYPQEFLNSQNPSGMPPHELKLKSGAIVMLIRNLNPKKGLCNGTRLVVKEMHNNFLICTVLSGANNGEIMFLPRIDLAPSDSQLPFVLKRRQFPIIPAFAITINKSQGQSFEHVGVYLNEPVFAHGQLYVAFSRSKNPTNIKVLLKQSAVQGNLMKDGRNFTPNIVFQEIFQ